MIYFDYAATTPMSREALDVYQQAAMKYYGNSSSLHDVGTSANQLLETCRAEIAKLLHGNSEGIYFTSGGSESNYLAIHTLLKGNAHKGKHIITTKTEHSSIFTLCKSLEKEGYDITFLDVDSNGIVSLQQLEKAIKKETCLVTIHHANSETGVLQPLAAIGKLLKDKKILFHSDCVQTFGKVPLDVKKYFLSSLSISAHKIYGPKGVGALYIDPAVSWHTIYEGATHERGIRPGTINVPGIAAFAAAAQQMHHLMESNQEKYKNLRRFFINQVKQSWLPVMIEAETACCLPHILGLRLQGMEGQHVMLDCNRKQIAISTGSACSAGSQTPSKTMLATGKTAEEAREFVRISFGDKTSMEDVQYLVQALKEISEDWIQRSVRKE